MTFVYFLIVLGILIFVHEFGHFIVAKRNGVKVDTFSLGFGPRLIGVRRGDTDYRISLIPFGGYVKMLGEDPSERNADDPRSFASKSVWARAKIIVMGSLSNIILCALILPVVFMIGRNEPMFLSEAPVLSGVMGDSPAEKAGMKAGDRIISLGGKKVSTWEDVLTPIMIGANSVMRIAFERDGRENETTIALGELPEVGGGYAGFEPILFLDSEAKIESVKKDGPAEKAGIKPGDMVRIFAGKKVASWIDLSERINKTGGAESDIVLVRDGQEIAAKVLSVYDKEHERWVIGILSDRRSGLPMKFVRLGFIAAVKKGFHEDARLALMTLTVFKKLVKLELSYKTLSGPIVIAKYSAVAAAMGLSDFLYFMAFVSIQLGILNLLPIPVLDGGQLVFLGLEAVFRRPVGVRVQEITAQAGFVLIILFMLLVTYNDIDRVWGVGRIIKKIF